MKRSEQVSLITGVVLLLALAAVFVISLMLQLFNFGVAGPGGDTMLYDLGHMIFSVYGFSSLLIPVFLCAAALLVVLPNWNSRKGLYLAASIIPFLTVVAVESFTVSFFTGTSLAVGIIKTSTFVLVSILLCSIEYILIGLVGEKFFRGNKKGTNRATAGVDIPQADVVQDFAGTSLDEQEEILTGEEAHQPIKTQKQPINLSNDDEYSFEAELFSNINPVPPSVPEALDNDMDFDVGILLEKELLSDANIAVQPRTQLSYGSLDDIGYIEDAELIEDIDSIENAPETFASNVAENIDEDVYDVLDDAVVNTEEDFSVEVYSINEDAATDYDFGETEGGFPMEDFSVEVHSESHFVDEDAATDDDFEEIDQFAEEALLPPVKIITSPPRRKKNSVYHVPVEGLLTTYSGSEYWIIDDQTQRAGNTLKETLNEFKIEAEVTGIRKGPVVTMFEILPAPGVKLSKIVALGDNIALRLAASSVRIVAPIPGKHAVGIEVPNKERSIVSFKELINVDTPAFNKMAIPVILGKDISGEAQIIDLVKTPHLLIAGSTGSGKSVCVNTMILSILYKRSPKDVRMILIDPKIVELKLYNDIPHLLTPVITEPKKAFQALQYCLCEMERRYALLDGMGVRDISSYNQRIKDRNIATEKLPYIVLIIDEFADLMATTGKELESTVARLAAMSRAIGIHLVLATQRPSIDVITGLIKANIPTRIAFMVASKMDSRIIIDQMGAEKLLGKGDMLYASAVDPFTVRIQGTFVSDDEIENVIDYVKQYGAPDYIDDEIFVDDEDGDFDQSLFEGGEDPLYEKALEIVMQAGKASASYIQRRLKIGYNRAARLVEDMEARGIVGPANGSKPREVLHMV